ncbi:MAG: ABC transporter permease [Streptosporangiaceae bacterium]
MTAASDVTGRAVRRRGRPRLRGVWVARPLVVVAFLGLVEVCVRVGLINPLFVSAPSAALGEAVRGLAGGALVLPLLVTLYESAIAFAAAAVVGLIVGYLLWRSATLTRAYEPLVGALFASPIILLYPIYLVLFGRTSVAISAQAATLGVLPVILYTRQGLAGVPDPLIKTAIVHRLSRSRALRYVLIPAAAPTIFTGLRLAVTYVLISVVAMEYLAQIGGLGKVINQSYLRFDMVRVYAAMAVVIVVTALLMAVTTWIERAVTR